MRRHRDSWLIGSIVLASLVLAFVLWRGEFFGSLPSSRSAVTPEISAENTAVDALSLPSSAASDVDASARALEVVPESQERVEVPRIVEPEVLRSKAVVWIDVEIEGAPVDVQLARVQVIADDESARFDESAERAILVEPTFGLSGSTRVDVTQLFQDPERMPSCLRVIAHVRSGCEHAQTVFVGITPEVMAHHNQLPLSCKLRLYCTRTVSGRLTAGGAGVQGRVRWLHDIPTSRWGADEPLSGRTEVDGRFELFATQAGEFHLVASAPDQMEIVIPVALDGFRDVDLGDIALEPGRRVDGVVSINGRPRARARVAFVPTGAKAIAEPKVSLRGQNRIKVKLEDERATLANGSSFVSAPRGLAVELLVMSNGVLSSEVVVSADAKGRFEVGELRQGRYEVGISADTGEHFDLEPQTIDVPAKDVRLDFVADVVELEFIDEWGHRSTAQSVEVALHKSDGSTKRFSVYSRGRTSLFLTPGTAAVVRTSGRELSIPPAPQAGTRTFRVTR